MKSEIALLYVPTPSDKEARDLARGLLQDGFIGCANIIPAMQSIYIWEGKVEESQEAIVILKSSREKIETLKTEVKKRHSYTVPCILELDVKDINAPYQDWLLAVLRSKEESGN